MAKVEFLGGQFWKAITAAAKSADRREVAVAFLTKGAAERLPLKKGDTLVVNAGDRALRSGSIQPQELRAYLKKGVQVYSCADLHGKVFVFDNTAIVGSTNVSELSYNDLHEAAVRTREPKAVADARDFVHNLPSEIVDWEFLKRADRIYKPPKFSPGSGQPTSASIEAWILRLMRKVGPVDFRPKHGYFIDLNKKSEAIWTAYVSAEKAGSGQGKVTLRVYPGDTISQARALYSTIKASRLFDLQKKGWKIYPNLHFGYMGTGLPPWVNRPTCGLRKYIEFWRANDELIRKIKKADLKNAGNILLSHKIISIDELREFVAYRSTKRQQIDIRPGIKLEFSETLQSFPPDLDKYSTILKKRLDQALRVWGDQWT